MDDYGSAYLYKNKDFSFTKYDSLGNQLGKLMMTVPFQVQDVQNPLTVFLFSENAQELKMLDTYLNEIQRIDFRQKFGFVKAAYTEDLQQVWLLDTSTNRLIQYNFRNDSQINSYPLNFNLDEVRNMLVYNGLVYLIKDNKLSVYNFKSKKIWEANIPNVRKLRRENDIIYAISKDEIYEINQLKAEEVVFSDENSQIVDKNSTSYFELKDNKLYLYPIDKSLLIEK